MRLWEIIKGWMKKKPTPPSPIPPPIPDPVITERVEDVELETDDGK